MTAFSEQVTPVNEFHEHITTINICQEEKLFKFVKFSLNFIKLFIFMLYFEQFYLMNLFNFKQKCDIFK